MRSIARSMAEYFRREYDRQYFASVALLLAGLFWINYTSDFETALVSSIQHPAKQVVVYFFFYALPYALTYLLRRITKGPTDTLLTPSGITLFLFSFALLSVYVVMHNVPWYATRVVPSLLPAEHTRYVARLGSNLLPGIVVLGPLFWYWRHHDSDASRLYGFSASGISLRTYLLVLLGISPLIMAISFTPDFLEAYPRWKFGMPSGLSDIEHVVAVAVFQFCYGVDFVFVELLFRGLMVMAFARYLGSGAIMPMVVVYAILHFQKPLGEAIGSVAGGLVLGVIAYNTRSIYGGVILHLGVAYMMEIAGTMQMVLAK